MSSIRICAVVVTYNRKQLLTDCLTALERQTYPFDQVFIVNNASCDGTESFLAEQGFLANPLFKLVNLPKNLGGAGGFHHGIKLGFEAGYDYILLMDDDGYPADDCLEKLLEYKSTRRCIGSLVLDKDKPQQLCFPIRLPNSTVIINSLQDIERNKIQGSIADIIIPFNGVLLSKEIVAQMGYPLPEYFIWGDDMEYIWRLQAHGIKIATIVAAKFYHPREEQLGTKMFFGQMRFNDTPSALKLYCMCRNNTVNLIKYKGHLAFIAFLLKLSWFYSLTNPNLKRLKIGLIAVWHGYNKDFSHHQDYLT